MQQLYGALQVTGKSKWAVALKCLIRLGYGSQCSGSHKGKTSLNSLNGTVVCHVATVQCKLSTTIQLELSVWCRMLVYRPA